jgi:hypothetical protein
LISPLVRLHGSTSYLQLQPSSLQLATKPPPAVQLQPSTVQPHHSRLPSTTSQPPANLLLFCLQIFGFSISDLSLFCCCCFDLGFFLLPTISEVWIFDLGFFFFGCFAPFQICLLFVNLVSNFFGLFVSFGGIAVDFLLDFHLNSPSQSAKQVRRVSLNFSSSI